MRMTKGIIKDSFLLEARLGRFCLWGLTTNYKPVLGLHVFCPQTLANHCKVAQDAAGCI